MSDDRGVFRGGPPRLLLAVAVIVVGLALWQLASGIRGGSDDETATTVTTLSQPDLDPDTLDGGWLRVDLPGRAPLDHVALVDATLYASGWNGIESEVWRSENALEWQRVPDPDGVFVGGIVNDFVALDGVVVAVGAREVEAEAGRISTPAVWRSQDGESFTALSRERVGHWGPSDGAVAGGSLEAVIAVEGRLVAVGWHGRGTVRGPSETSLGAVWVSEFGDTWDVAFETPDELGGPGTVLADVTRTEAGATLAVGTTLGSATVWQSVDGRAWSRLAEPDAAQFTSTIGEGKAVAATPLRAVVLGAGNTSAGAPEPYLWGLEGESWELLAIPELDSVALSSLAELSPGFLATGSRSLTDGRQAAGMWASPSGADWSPVDIDSVPLADAVLNDAAAHPSGVVVVGEVFQQPALWVRPRDLAGVEEFAAGAPLPPPAWATIFQEQAPSNSAPQQLALVESGIFGFSDVRVAWFSPDGRGWTPTRFDDAGLSSMDRVLAVVENDERLVAVGEGDEPAVWTSEDGSTWHEPTKSPPCCISALFPAVDGGFRALGRDPADDGWFVASSDDGEVWSIIPELPNLMANAIWASATVGSVDMVWTTTADATQAWTSADGVNWLEVEDLGVVEWTGVWPTSDAVLAAAQTTEGVALFDTDGTTWRRLDVTGLPVGDVTIFGAAAVAEGHAVLVGEVGRPLQLYLLGDGGVAANIPLTGTRGFGGLSAVLVNDGDQLRVVGPAHGRMTVWEWVPAE